ASVEEPSRLRHQLTPSAGRLIAPYRDAGLRQASRCCLHCERAWLPRSAFEDRQAEAVIPATLLRLKRFVAGGVTVADGHDLARADDVELHQIMASRNRHPSPVGDRHGDEREVASVGANIRAIDR